LALLSTAPARHGTAELWHCPALLQLATEPLSFGIAQQSAQAPRVLVPLRECWCPTTSAGAPRAEEPGGTAPLPAAYCTLIARVGSQPLCVQHHAWAPGVRAQAGGAALQCTRRLAGLEGWCLRVCPNRINTLSFDRIETTIPLQETPYVI